MRSTKSTAVLGMVAICALVLIGCDNDSKSSSTAPTTQAPTSTTSASSTDESASTTGTQHDPDSFCGRAKARESVPESYVGSTEHIAELDGWVRTAPADIRATAIQVRDYIRENVDVDDPASKSIPNFPADVQAAIERLQNYISQNCS